MSPREILAGCSISVAVQGTGWIVVLQASGERPITVLVHRDLHEVLHTIQAWMLVMMDDSEARLEPKVTVDELREQLARSALGKHPRLPQELSEVQQWDQLRAWFEREMGA